MMVQGNSPESFVADVGWWGVEVKWVRSPYAMLKS